MLCSEIPPWCLLWRTTQWEVEKRWQGEKRDNFKWREESFTMQGTAFAGDPGCSGIFKAEHTAQTQGSVLLPLFYEWNIKQGHQLCKKSRKETDMQGEGEWSKNSGHVVWMDCLHVNNETGLKGFLRLMLWSHIKTNQSQLCVFCSFHLHWKLPPFQRLGLTKTGVKSWPWCTIRLLKNVRIL